MFRVLASVSYPRLSDADVEGIAIRLKPNVQPIKFQDFLSYIVRPCPKQTNKIAQHQTIRQRNISYFANHP